MTTSAVAEPVELQDVGRDTARELTNLREQRGDLALDGDLAQLAVVEARISELERELERGELAREARLRRERESVTAAAEDERHRRLAENERLAAERDVLIGETVLAARRVAELAGRAITLDNEIEANTRALGGSHRRLASLVGDRIAVELLDAGVQGAIGPIFASWRAALLRTWPTPEQAKPTVALCTVCGHPDRAAIEAALAGGDMTLRATEELYGVSRSALSRHRAHSSTA